MYGNEVSNVKFDNFMAIDFRWHLSRSAHCAVYKLVTFVVKKSLLYSFPKCSKFSLSTDVFSEDILQYLLKHDFSAAHVTTIKLPLLLHFFAVRVLQTADAKS